MAVVSFGSVRSCGVTTLALSLAATWPPAATGCCWSKRTRPGGRWPRAQGGRPSPAWCRWPRQSDAAANRPWCGTTATSFPAERRCWPVRPRPTTPAARWAWLRVCWAVSVSSTPTCWWTAGGSTRARPPSGSGNGPSGWCWPSGRAWPTCTLWPAGSKAARPRGTVSGW